MSKVDALAAEVKAVEEGTKARRLGEHTYAVRCLGSCGEEVSSHVVTVEYRGSDRPVHFLCDCLSGRYRLGTALPCVHAATVGRRLEREGLVVWRDGAFWRKPAEKLAQVIDLWCDRKPFTSGAR